MIDQPKTTFEEAMTRYRVATKSWQFWFRTQVCLLIAQIAALLYTVLLPESIPLTQSPSLPFFYCFILACIPLTILGKKRGRILAEMQAINNEVENDYYQMLTGTTKS